MNQYDLIRTAHRVYGKNVSEIARETGHSRNTITKALAGAYARYTPRQSQPYPVLGPYREHIEAWLEQDKGRPKKQRHTAHRIYERLVAEHAYPGSEPTVRRYVREAKARLGLNGQAVFSPCEPPVGREAEVDWGTATAMIQGVSTTIKFFCMRSKYSGKHLVRCYPCERQQAFFDAHLQAFAFFGGIFPVLIYDNLTSAVRKVLQGRTREEQETFTRFRIYHSFEARFCNPGQGHEKGGVEGLVGYARRNYLVPVPEVDSLDQLNEQVFAQCVRYGSHRLSGREQTVTMHVEQEQPSLLSVPEVPFSNVQTVAGKVNKYATVRIDRNQYSVPHQYVGFRVQGVLTVDRLRLYYGQKEIAAHARAYGCNKWVLQPEHYLELLQQRPQAFDSARPIAQWRAQWPPSFDALLAHFQQHHGQTNGIKEFLAVLGLHRDHPSAEIQAAVELALETHVSSSDGVKHLLDHLAPEDEMAPLAQWSSLPAPDVSVYGQLQTGGEQ